MNASMNIYGPARPMLFGFSAAALALGGAIAAASRDAKILALAAGLASVPLLLSIAARRPEILVALWIAVQPLEALEVSTPVGTVSAGILVLVMGLAVIRSDLSGAIRENRAARILLTLLVVWVCLFPMRMLHDEPGIVLRQMITMASYLLVAILGIGVAARRRVLTTVALGATAALTVLGLLGILVALGLFPAPQRLAQPRSFLGITSPFVRNYGLNVPWDAVALLLPLCVPYLLLYALRRRGSSFKAFIHTLAFVAVVAITLFVFQARGMMLQVAAALFLGIAVSYRRRGAWLLALGVPIVALLVRELVQLDELASSVRAVSYGQVLREVASNPLAFVFGVNENAFFTQGLLELGVLRHYSTLDNSVHNFFISNLVGGGYLAFLLSLAIFLFPLRHAWRCWRQEPDRFDVQVVLVALVLILIEASVQPLRAGVVGAWLMIGISVSIPRTAQRREAAALKSETVRRETPALQSA